MLLTARYVLPVSTPHIENGGVLVRDDSVAEVGDAEQLKAKHPSEEVVDFGLAALVPGFIDTHTHLEYTAMRGLVDDLPYSQWKLQVLQKEERLTDEDWRDSALMGALEAVRSGITTVADITSRGHSAVAAQECGIRAVVYREVSTIDARSVDRVMGEATEDVERWRADADPSRVAIGIAPHSAYSCHPKLFRAVADYASDGTPVSMHLAGSKEEYEFVKYGSSMLATDVREEYDASAPAWLPTGVSPVRYVLQWGLFEAPNVLAAHCTQVDDADIEILAANDVAVAYCPRCNAKLAMGVAPVDKFLRAGLRVGMGTDSPAAANSMDPFEDMRVGVLVQRAMLGSDKWMTTRQFIRLATGEAARALAMHETLGTLDPGKQADVIAVDLSKSSQIPTHYPYSALVHTANQQNVLMTMVGGRILFDRRKRVLDIDEERLSARAEEMRIKLRS
jgi:5-methylthioadenosine/S-adenosylhomocysteine deaminase